MNAILDCLKTNRGLTYSLAGLIIVVLVVATAAGCQLEDLVRFSTPEGVQGAIAVEATVPVSKADQVWTDWQHFVATNTERLQAEITNGRERAAVLMSIVDTGIAAASGPISTLPGGAIAVGAMSLLTGLFLKRPGDRKREAEAIAKAVEDATAKDATA